MPGDDLIRLRHRLDASREAVASAAGRSRADLDRDRVWALGLIKCVEIVGEAAGKIGKDLRARHPQVPWAPIAAMRNRLVHAYFDIDPEQVWKAVNEDLPALIAQIEDVLSQEERLS